MQYSHNNSKNHDHKSLDEALAKADKVTFQNPTPDASGGSTGPAPVHPGNYGSIDEAEKHYMAKARKDGLSE